MLVRSNLPHLECCDHYVGDAFIPERSSASLLGIRSRARGLDTWRRREHASANASGRSAVKRDCRSTTSKRAPSLEFKASVLGAYERGERAISVPRLLRLAEIYEVPADQLLPRDFEGEISLVESAGGSADQTSGFAIDLVRLHDVDEPDAQIISRFASSIQLERQDFNGRMLTIRRSDLRVLAACMGRSLEELGCPARATRPARPGESAIQLEFGLGAIVLR